MTTRPETLWVCPACGHQDRQPAVITKVYHRCRTRRGRLTPMRRSSDPLHRDHDDGRAA